MACVKEEMTVERMVVLGEFPVVVGGEEELLHVAVF